MNNAFDIPNRSIYTPSKKDGVTRPDGWQFKESRLNKYGAPSAECIKPRERKPEALFNKRLLDKVSSISDFVFKDRYPEREDD